MAVRPRPSLVSAALLVLSLIHAAWGLKLLARGNVLMGGTQFVSAGGLLLASAGSSSRQTLATGLFIASAATSVRLLAQLSSPSPFAVPTAALVAGMAVAAWGSRTLDTKETHPYAPAALRGGFVMMAFAYLGFVGLDLAFGGNITVTTLDLAARAGASVLIASFIDAPPIASRRDERKAFGAEAPMRTR